MAKSFVLKRSHLPSHDKGLGAQTLTLVDGKISNFRVRGSSLRCKSLSTKPTFGKLTFLGRDIFTPNTHILFEQ